MNVNIRGVKVVITDAIKNHINSKINKLEKYFVKKGEVDVNVVVRLRGHEQIIEVTIPVKHFTIRAEESDSDLYTAVDLVIDKVERQIRKNKTRLASKLHKETHKEVEYNFDNTDIDEDQGAIVKRKQVDSKPMSEEEAILQMNLLGHAFFVFNNVDNGCVCVIYSRKDNGYGIIELG